MSVTTPVLNGSISRVSLLYHEFLRRVFELAYLTGYVAFWNAPVDSPNSHILAIRQASPSKLITTKNGARATTRAFLNIPALSFRANEIPRINPATNPIAFVAKLNPALIGVISDVAESADSPIQKQKKAAVMMEAHIVGLKSKIGDFCCADLR